MKHRDLRRDLVEWAITLVIVALSLGTMFAGQILIQSAGFKKTLQDLKVLAGQVYFELLPPSVKAKRTFNNMKRLEIIAWAFHGKYGRFPGDCPADAPDGIINDRVSGTWTLETLGTSDAAPTQPCDSGEGWDDTPFHDLRWAGIVDKTVPDRQAFKHAFNGPFFLGHVAVGGTNYNIIAVNDIPCWVAKMIDQSVDGSIDAGTGKVRELTGNSVSNSSSNWSCTNEDASVDLVYFFDKQP